MGLARWLGRIRWGGGWAAISLPDFFGLCVGESGAVHGRWPDWWGQMVWEVVGWAGKELGGGSVAAGHEGVGGRRG